MTNTPSPRGNDLQRPLSAELADPEAVRALLDHPGTLIMPLLECKNFFNGPDDLEPVLVRAASFPDLPERARSVALLGMAEDSPVFGADLDPDALPPGLEEMGTFLDLRRTLSALDPDNIPLLGLSRALAHWHRHNGFCPSCGSPSESAQAGRVRVCANPDCAREIFPRTDPAVIVLAERNGRCLLGRQAGWKKNMYSPIAGFVEPCEDLEAAVRRELEEETGILSGKVRYHNSQPWPFPASLMAAFRAEALNEDIVPRDTELEDARWFSREDIVQGLANKTLGLPAEVSISFNLIETWFNEAPGADLKTIIP